MFDPPPGTPSPDALRIAGDRVAAAARDAGVLAEQVVVAIKQSWSRMARPQGPDGRERSRHAMSALVSATIDAYYREGRRAAALPSVGARLSEPERDSRREPRA